MSRPRLPRALLVLAIAFVGACGDDPAPAPVPAKPTDAPAATPAPSAEATAAEKAARMVEEAKRKFDEDARGLLRSFESRAYDPRRDGRMTRASGTLVVRSGEKSATYRFTYDAANPPERPVVTEPVSEPEGWDPTLARRARGWALQSCVGAFEIVAFHRPPVAYSLTPSVDRKNLVVTVPPFRGPLSVSYSFDDRQVVTIRGEWTDEQHRAVTSYEWDFYHGRYMLRRESIHDGPVAEFEYDDGRGLPLLSRVRLTHADRADTAELRYETVERRSD